MGFTTMRSNILSPTLSILLLLGIAGCSSTDFGGVSGRASSDKSDDGDDDDEADAPTDDESADDDADDADDEILENETGSPDDPTFNIDEAGNARQSFKADAVALVDIAFFVDTSGSMRQEMDALEVNMGAFLRQFVDETKIDFQLFLVGKGSGFDFPADVIGNEHVEYVPTGVSSRDGLKIAQKFMSGEIPLTKLAWREKAIKELVFVTDDNGSNPDGAQFATYLGGRADETHVNGIVGLANGGGAGCGIASVGTSYIELAALEPHKGLIQDLCKQDWNGMLKNLNEAIAARANLEYELKKPPTDGDGISVSVDGKKLSSEDFSYDADSNMVIIKADKAPEVGDTVVITFPTKV